MLNLQYLPEPGSLEPLFPLYDPPFDLDEEEEEEFYDDGDYEDDIIDEDEEDDDE